MEYLVTLRSVFIQEHPISLRRTEPTGPLSDKAGHLDHSCVGEYTTQGGTSFLVAHEVTRIQEECTGEIRPEAERTPVI